MDREEHPCSYCGLPTTNISSGRYECRRCWEWRKLGAAEARYWSEAIDNLRGNENGTIDSHDFMVWDRWGMLENVERALYTLVAINHAYHAMLDDPRPWAVENE